MRILKNHGLSIFFAIIFLLSLGGQALSGLGMYNEEQASHGRPPITLPEYLTSSDFAVGVSENWQSEFLQFFLFILATVWLVQKGSPESKQPGEEGVESDEQQFVAGHARANSPKWAKAHGWRLALYSNSLLLVMGGIFLMSWFVQSLTGLVTYNQQQLDHAQPPLAWTEYLASPEFWNRTLQNWQSEFLAVGCMVAFSIFLRQRGSVESKPVGAPHAETSVSG